jgi:NADH-quinone oxidoreductase subunit F
MIVVDDDTCMVEFAKFFLTFATAESCGKCVPCRIGGKRMLEVLTDITEGKGTLEDLGTIRELAAGMETGSLCALGQLTPGPVVSALRYFEDEFRAHILDNCCPALQCKLLVSYYILPDKCAGCGICLRACPSEAISGGKRMIHLIDQSKCTKCRTCLDVCPSRFSAVVAVSGESVQTPERPIPVGEWES